MLWGGGPDFHTRPALGLLWAGCRWQGCGPMMRETLPKPFSCPSMEVGPAGLWGHGFGWLIGRQMCDNSNLSGTQEAPPLGGTYLSPPLGPFPTSGWALGCQVGGQAT